MAECTRTVQRWAIATDANLATRRSNDFTSPPTAVYVRFFCELMRTR
ncbi:hypothetical protein SH661x_002681 [Planctomicrobium sp. SH661]